MRRFRGFALLFSLGSLAGCAELLPADPGMCGNGFQEVGEDCDGAVPKEGLKCGDRGFQACRFLCEEKETKPGERTPCPDGYGCGANDVCRKPEDKWRSLGDALEEDATGIVIADFDADGRKDALIVGDERLRVHFFDQNAVLAKTLSITAQSRDPQGEPAEPAIGYLTSTDSKIGDETADFVVHVGKSIGVFRGKEDRSLVPTQYPFAEGKPGETSRTFTVDALPNLPGKEALYMEPDMKLMKSRIIDPTKTDGEMDPWFIAGDPKDLTEDVPAANLIIDTPCEEFVLAFVDDSKVTVVSPCSAMNADNYSFSSTEVTLPKGHKVRDRAHVADMNLDGYLDLVVGATANCGDEKNEERCCVVDVAYGDGKGTFYPTADLSIQMGVSASTLAYPGTGYSDPDLLAIHGCSSTDPSPLLPLAVGDVNGDGIPDIVDPRRVILGEASMAGLTFTDVEVESDRLWGDAIIADFDADGITDVIAGKATASGIDFLRGSTLSGETAFNLFNIPTNRPTAHFTAGDFDGDSVIDLAFIEPSLSTSADSTDDALEIVFGRPYSAPEAPVELGRLNRAAQVVAGPLSDGWIGGGDAVSDLAVITVFPIDDSASVHRVLLFPGSTSRQYQSPYRLSRPGTMDDPKDDDTPLRIAVGNFNDGLEHADIAVLSENSKAQTNSDAFALWQVKATGEAELVSSKIIPMPTSLPSLSAALTKTSPPMQYVRMIPIDLDEDVLDELVILVPDSTALQSLLFIADPSNETGAAKKDVWTFAPTTPTLIDGTTKGWNALQAFASDIDQDGWKDLVVLFGGNAGSRSLAVFWNDKTGTLGDSKVSVLELEPRSTEDDAYPRSIAALNVKEDKTLEIAVPYENWTVIVSVDASARKFKEPVVSDDLPGGALIAAGDLTGDGVDDLVFSDKVSVQFFQGIPTNSN